MPDQSAYNQRLPDTQLHVSDDPWHKTRHQLDFIGIAGFDHAQRCLYCRRINGEEPLDTGQPVLLGCGDGIAFCGNNAIHLEGLRQILNRCRVSSNTADHLDVHKHLLTRLLKRSYNLSQIVNIARHQIHTFHRAANRLPDLGFFRNRGNNGVMLHFEACSLRLSLGSASLSCFLP
ncbi:hypothetical protein D3C80_1541430 [compost metagenome]